MLAQAGSFVPAARAKVGIVDRLFSRVGASDNLARGRSTFMVEMVETAAILAQATPQSLVILDEIGRGTSTYDGLAIAWAVVEAMHDQVQCRTLFATHYHELTRLAEPARRAVAAPRPGARMEGRPRPAARGRRRRRRPQLRHRGRQARRPAAAVVARAKSVLAKLEAGRDATGGIAAGLDDLPLFATAAEPEHGARSARRRRSTRSIPTRSPRARRSRSSTASSGWRPSASHEPARRSTTGARSSTDGRSPTGSPACAAARSSTPRPRRFCASALAAGRAEIARRLADEPGRGRAAAQATAFLHDQLVRLAYDFVVERLLDQPLDGSPGAGRPRRHRARRDGAVQRPRPHVPDRQGRRPPAAERAAEAMLHLLWDLKLKVGHSVRSQSQLIALAKKDMTVRTAFLEGRWLWGDEQLFDEAMRRFRKEVVAGTAAEFVAAKLAERDQRHIRMGDSRYVVEPNVKDGKGGLRDLHTLYWIGKYVHGVERPADLVGAGLLTAAEFRRFDRAERFFWSVRCHLHLLAGRAEERLSFDYQPRIAEIMHYADRPGKSAVERFMQFYFLNAKAVGDLTGLFLAQLDEQIGQEGLPLRPADHPPAAQAARRLHARPRAACRFPTTISSATIRCACSSCSRSPRASGSKSIPRRCARRPAMPRLIDREVRDDPRANALFLEVLTCVNHPELVLRWMNEAGVFGRFVPDFGRVVAQMQFDMYHHYTVDEHSIRAIGLLARDRARRAQGRPSAVDRDHQADRLAPRALRRGAAARHRQGPRRRPQRDSAPRSR